ncbi:MAG: alkylhydroperoxidase [Chlorobiaceae bacterium]|nr:alkylhydroperoxidase [Chlorobiaceae bacterium]
MSIRYFKPPPSVPAESLSGKVLTAVRREFGAEVEPFTLHLPVPELLAGAWMVCRETLLAGKGRRDAKEAVAATVSFINRCPYCVDAHSIMLLEASGVDHSKAISDGKPELIKDSYLSAVSQWAAATLSPVSPLLAAPPFSAGEAPAFIGTAVFFHYINRMVTILLGASPLPFTEGFPKKVSMQMAAWFFGGAIRLEKKAGTSLGMLPEAPLPEDLAWAKPSAEVAGAFAAFSREIEKAGETAIPEKVRAAIKEAIDAWDGSDPGTGSAWMDATLKKLNEPDKAAGKLSLLAALAPYRVNDELVSSYSSRFPGNENLLSALAWSSFTAARKIGTWIAPC